MSQHLANGASAAENVQKSLATDVQCAKPDETKFKCKSQD